MRKLHSLLVVLTLSLAGCSDTSGPPPDVVLQIEGTVTNATTGRPLQGVAIRLAGLGFNISIDVARTSTDEQGHYAISYPAPACTEIYVLEPRLEGFFAIRTGPLIRPRCTGEVQRYDYSMAPAAAAGS